MREVPYNARDDSRSTQQDASNSKGDDNGIDANNDHALLALFHLPK